MTAIAFYQDTALANRVPEALSPVYLSQTDSLVTPVGYTSCQLDLAVSLAASIADWRDQTVTNKPARECLWHSVGVQYPGRMHRQPCVILYILGVS